MRAIRVFRISAANIGPNRFHQNRTVSWLMSIPRSARRSSTLPGQRVFHVHHHDQTDHFSPGLRYAYDPPLSVSAQFLSTTTESQHPKTTAVHADWVVELRRIEPRASSRCVSHGPCRCQNGKRRRSIQVAARSGPRRCRQTEPPISPALIFLPGVRVFPPDIRRPLNPPNHPRRTRVPPPRPSAH
jgi:hypothetical protein